MVGRVPSWRIGKHVGVAIEGDPGEALRAWGLRVTPQRRAILGAFSSGAEQHLSADEVHARATAVIPEIGRGTVYSTLAELTELGLLLAHGSPEPVRYETNTEPHQHFRCRLCLRLIDVEMLVPVAGELTKQGFDVERMTVTAEGVCADCVAYGRALRSAARRARARPSSSFPDGMAAAVMDTLVGPLAMGATSQGVTHVVFDNHADAPRLREMSRRRLGGAAARRHLAAATEAVNGYFAGRAVPACAIDWESVGGAATLQAAMAAPPGEDTSYDVLATSAGAAASGRLLGGNPVAILVPCHRITRGREVPAEYVGGPEQREALRAFERARQRGR